MRPGQITTKLAALLLALTAIAVDANASLADNYAGCGDDVATAISRARTSIEADSPRDDRRALICLVQAVEALNRKIEEVSKPNEPLRLLVVPGTRPEDRP